MPLRNWLLAATLFMICRSPWCLAHDTWVETNTNLIRTGDAVYASLMLGNHGNDHRDFKLASKISLDGVKLNVRAPAGKTYDLVPSLSDRGYSPKEGFWAAKFAATAPGLYLVEHSLDRVVNHGKPLRSLKSAKTFFVVSESLDRVPQENPGYDLRCGHELELVPESNPVTPMGPDVPIRVQVLWRGQPLPNAKVSFIPRGAELAEGFDPEFERMTNEKGRAMWIPKEGNSYLVVIHHESEDAGEGYVGTKYSATLTVFVPDVCPCCGE